MKKILIAYHSNFGSTREAAEIISLRLRKANLETVVQPVGEVRSIEEFDTVIIGAPINGMQWFPSATNFALDHKEELAAKKTAFFCLSYIYFTGSAFWKKAILKAFDPASREVKPLRTAIFGGRIDASLPRPMRFIFGIPADAPLSLFDPEAIQNWTADLIREL